LTGVEKRRCGDHIRQWGVTGRCTPRGAALANHVQRALDSALAIDVILLARDPKISADGRARFRPEHASANDLELPVRPLLRNSDRLMFQAGEQSGALLIG
jgi:hypothetical protein